MVPYPTPECILKGGTGEHEQKNIIHCKHLEELNVPHHTTKYCLMYTIKIIHISVDKPQQVLQKKILTRTQKMLTVPRSRSLGFPAFRGISARVLSWQLEIHIKVKYAFLFCNRWCCYIRNNPTKLL